MFEKEIKRLKNNFKEFLKKVEDKNESKDIINISAAVIKEELDEIIKSLFRKEL